MSAHFEGSYPGDDSMLDEAARLECKICWYLYDPTAGDAIAQIPSGTALSALPSDWHCPQCDAPRTAFLVCD